MIKRLLAAATAATLMAGILTGCGASETRFSDSGTIELRLAQASSAEGAIGISMDEYAERVKEASNGHIEIITYHNGQLGTERDNVEACQLGNLDMAVVNTSVLANFIPWFSAFDLPYVIQSAEHADKVFLGEIGDDMRAAMGDVDIVGLSIWESGFRNLTNSKRDVNSLEDVKGLRIRVMENQVHQALWGALDVDAVPMNWSDAYTGMQQGAIDGQENPTTVIDKNNVVEVNKHMALTQHVYSTVSVIMSPRTWNALSEADQQILIDCMKEEEVDERTRSREMDLEAIATLESQGMVVTYPDTQPFIDGTESVREEYGADYQEILERVSAANQ